MNARATQAWHHGSGRAAAALLLAAVLLACSSRDDARDRTGTEAGTRAAFTSFPPTGIAVRDTAMAWCAAFPDDPPPARTPKAGDTVAIVFATPDAPPAWYARVQAPRSAMCHTEFAQPRWDSYRAFDLALTEADSAADVSSIALVVGSAARWRRETDGRVLADLNGDGEWEEARRCTADEGEHFTVWSVSAARQQRRAHDYYDWGAHTDATCREGEDGRDMGLLTPGR